MRPSLKLTRIMATFQRSLSEQSSGIFPVFSFSLLIVQEEKKKIRKKYILLRRKNKIRDRSIFKLGTATSSSTVNHCSQMLYPWMEEQIRL